MGKFFYILFLYYFDFFSDLKPNNIVLTNHGHVRLIDFGSVTSIEKGKLKVLPLQVAKYSSPEVWNQKPAGLASDWWPYGIIVAYLYQLQMPFVGETEDEVQKNVTSEKPYLDNMPHKRMDLVRKFIKKLLVVDPAKRLKNVSENIFFEKITESPFAPGVIIPPSATSKEAGEYASENQSVYEDLEGLATRFPTAKFLASDKL